MTARGRKAWRLVGVALVVGLAGCHRESTKTGAGEGEAASLPVRTVQTGVLEPTSLMGREEVVATVRARRSAVLAAQISGPVTEVTVELGVRVESGQLLVRIHGPEYQARLRQAEAQRELAQRDLQREEKLFRQQASNESDLDAARSRFATAEALVEETRTIAGFTEVRAPFDGVVTRRAVNPGDLATPGRSLLELEDPSDLLAEAQVPEALGGLVARGDSLEVTVANAGAVVTGLVTEVSPVADPVSRTFLVKIALPDHPALRSGRFARVAVPTEAVVTFLVPEGAVARVGQLERVFVVDGDRARLRLVKTGVHRGDRVEIVAGLDAGERFIVESDGVLRDGQRVIAGGEQP